MLRGPHLVLTHAGRHNGARLGALRNCLHHCLGTKRSICHRFVVSQRIRSLPIAKLSPPRFVLRGFLETRVECRNNGRHLTVQGNVGTAHLVEFSAVNVDVNNFRVWRKAVKTSRHAVVEPRPERNQ